MRYGTPYNVHKVNKRSPFTEDAKGWQSVMDDQPVLKEGYSYEPGEDMVQVGEVGVNQKRGAGRDGQHHALRGRAVYKRQEQPEKEVVIEQKPAATPQAPVQTEPEPTHYSPEITQARERLEEPLPEIYPKRVEAKERAQSAMQKSSEDIDYTFNAGEYGTDAPPQSANELNLGKYQSAHSGL